MQRSKFVVTAPVRTVWRVRTIRGVLSKPLFASLHAVLLDTVFNYLLLARRSLFNVFRFMFFALPSWTFFRSSSLSRLRVSHFMHCWSRNSGRYCQARGSGPVHGNSYVLQHGGVSPRANCRWCRLQQSPNVGQSLRSWPALLHWILLCAC